jgi:hypothetical protein
VTTYVAPDALVRGASATPVAGSPPNFICAPWADEGVRPYVSCCANDAKKSKHNIYFVNFNPAYTAGPAAIAIAPPIMPNLSLPSSATIAITTGAATT